MPKNSVTFWIWSSLCISLLDIQFWKASEYIGEKILANDFRSLQSSTLNIPRFPLDDRTLRISTPIKSTTNTSYTIRKFHSLKSYLFDALDNRMLSPNVEFLDILDDGFLLGGLDGTAQQQEEQLPEFQHSSLRVGMMGELHQVRQTLDLL